ncbi:MAG: hypothetical protein RL095_634 [Verrucomicrobiota bacterium]
MNAAAFILTVAALIMSVAARRNPASKARFMRAPSAILAILFGASGLLVSSGARLQDGCDLDSARARAEFIVRTAQSEAALKSLSGQRLILITGQPPEDAQPNKEFQISLEEVMKGLAGWKIEVIKIPSGFSAFKSAELEKRLSGKEWDVLVSFIGLPQDLDCMAAGDLGELCAKRVVIVGSGSIEDVDKALELKLFDRALAPDSVRNRNYGTCLDWKGRNQVVDIRGQRSP